MRTNLTVPFAEKDEAKKLGARWDAARKLWYVEGKPDLAPFSRWMNASGGSAKAGGSADKAASANTVQAAGKLVVGSKYVAHPSVCTCLPWEVCEKCAATAISR